MKKNNIALKLLAATGIFFIGKFLVDKIINYVYYNIEYVFGNPVIDWRGLANYPQVIKVNLPMTVINKTPVTVTVKSFVGELYYGNIKVSNIVIPQSSVVPAKGQATFDLKIDIQAMQVINDIIASLGQTGTYSTLINVLKLKGVLETSMYRIPIETNISIV
jgi:LEA14-like dessication related protein